MDKYKLWVTSNIQAQFLVNVSGTTTIDQAKGTCCASNPDFDSTHALQLSQQPSWTSTNAHTTPRLWRHAVTWHSTTHTQPAAKRGHIDWRPTQK